MTGACHCSFIYCYFFTVKLYGSVLCFVLLFFLTERVLHFLSSSEMLRMLSCCLKLADGSVCLPVSLFVCILDVPSNCSPMHAQLNVCTMAVEG